ncbi:MAG TPA: hypothetical protein VNM68_15165, partial [Candidatus Polarisedimenticolia bacterium]|nr:hypothetical protein [Candidatus Polarisedimenticolia bacterium]
VADGLPTTMPAALQLTDETSEPERKPALSGLASSPRHLADSFEPLPLRGWFLLIQLLPALGFAGLWAWDQRRRHLALHPEIVRRRAARRQLRRQRRMLKRAAAEGDAPGYARYSVAAMQIACAPHYLAEPRALVCGDVLNVLNAPEREGRTGEVIRQLFAAADDSRFAVSPRTPVEAFALKPELDGILLRLEERL